MVLKNDNTLWKTEAIQQHQKKYEYYHSLYSPYNKHFY